MSYNRNLAPKEDPLEGKTIPAGAELNIAVLHYSVEEIAPPIWEEPVIKVDEHRDRTPRSRYSPWGTSTSHLRPRSTTATYLYPGGTEHYNFGEWEQDTGFMVVDYNRELKIEYVKVESQPMKQLKLHTSHLNT